MEKNNRREQHILPEHQAARKIMRKLCKMRPEIEQLHDEDFKNSLILMLDEFEGCPHPDIRGMRALLCKEDGELAPGQV